MKRMLLILLSSTVLSAQPGVSFKNGTFYVESHQVQPCLLDRTLKQMASQEQLESYTAQGGRFDVVRYGDNEYGLVSNGSLPGGGPILGWVAWGAVKAIGHAPDAIARKVAKKKARHDEERISRGEAPHHQPPRTGGVNPQVKELQGVFDKLAVAVQEYCNKLPTP
jgi:hypothetical protein